MTSKTAFGLRKRVGVAGAVAALVTPTLAGIVQLPATAKAGPVAIHGVAGTAAERQTVLAYWTPQRIADLKTPVGAGPPQSEFDASAGDAVGGEDL